MHANIASASFAFHSFWTCVDRVWYAYLCIPTFIYRMWLLYALRLSELWLDVVYEEVVCLSSDLESRTSAYMEWVFLLASDFTPQAVRQEHSEHTFEQKGIKASWLHLKTLKVRLGFSSSGGVCPTAQRGWLKKKGTETRSSLLAQIFSLSFQLFKETSLLT